MLQFASISENIEKLLISIDSTIYRFVGWLYEVYLSIASARIIKQDAIENFMKRLMVVIGIVMLFVVSFSLIKAIIDPDKEVKNTSKIFVNVVTSIIMLTLVNTVFNYLYEGQNILIKSNVIGKIIIGGAENFGGFDINSAGTNMAVDTYGAFFQENPSVAVNLDDEKGNCYKNIDGDKYTEDEITDDTTCFYRVDDEWFDENYRSKKQIMAAAKRTGDMTTTFGLLGIPVDHGAIDFSFLLALIAGGFMIYIFVSFCLDMGKTCCFTNYFSCSNISSYNSGARINI